MSELCFIEDTYLCHQENTASLLSSQGKKIQIALENDLSKDLEQVHPKIFYECSLIWLSPAVGGGAKGSDGDVGWTD